MTRIFVILLGTFLVACTSSEQSNNLDSEVEGTSLEDFQKSLQGTWERPCSYDAANGYYKQAIAFAGFGGGFAIVTKDFFFSDSACNFPTLDRIQSLTVFDMNANGNLYTYTATVSTQTIMPRTTAIAASMTSVKACGINQWNAGVSLDTSSTSCNTMGSISDTISMVNGNLFRALDEVKFPSVISGTLLQGAPYTKTH